MQVPEEAKYYGDFTLKSGYQGIIEIFKFFIPDALFCVNDYMAAGAMMYINEIGLKIPNDISVVGYDNFDIAPVLSPPLTTVDNRFYYLGEYMASKLIDLISHRTSDIHVQVKPFLVNRNSVRS